MKPVKYFAQLKPKTVYLVVFFLLFLFLLYNLFIKQTILEGRVDRSEVLGLFKESNKGLLENFHLWVDFTIGFGAGIKPTTTHNEVYGLHDIFIKAKSRVDETIEETQKFTLSPTDGFKIPSNNVNDVEKKAIQYRKELLLTFFNGFVRILNDAIVNIPKIIPSKDNNILSAAELKRLKDKMSFYVDEGQKLQTQLKQNIFFDDYILNPATDRTVLKRI